MSVKTISLNVLKPFVYVYSTSFIQDAIVSNFRFHSQRTYFITLLFLHNMLFTAERFEHYTLTTQLEP